MCFEAGAKILAVSDIQGGIYAAGGLDMPAVLAHYEKNRTLKGFPGAEAIDATRPCSSSTATS